MTSFQPHKVILFDHDGTVVDSETIALKSAWRLTGEVLHEFPGGKSYSQAEFIRRFAGKPYREILVQIYAGSTVQLTEADIERLVLEEEDRAIDCLNLAATATEGTPEVLSHLCDKGYPFALVSNSSLRRLSACLAASDLNVYFPIDRIFSAHDSLPVRRPKPLPDVYLHAAKCLNAEIPDCIAVEDSTSGVNSAIAAGIPQVIGYIGGTHISEDERSDRASALRSAGVHYIIEQMSDLLQFLGEKDEPASIRQEMSLL